MGVGWRRWDAQKAQGIYLSCLTMAFVFGITNHHLSLQHPPPPSLGSSL